MDKLKLIKSIVFVLTLLLIIGSFSIIMLLFKKTSTPSTLNAKINLEEPYGSYIKDFKIKDDYIYILTSGGGKEDRIIIYDTTTNKQVSTININK